MYGFFELAFLGSENYSADKFSKLVLVLVTKIRTLLPVF